jgi:LuxR family maltose regulon positive regulatory protein
VLAGRAAPPLRPWLKARSRLREVGGGALAFTADEAERLLRAHDVVLSDEDLAELVRRTRGLAARLRLAATSLTERGTPVLVGHGPFPFARRWLRRRSVGTAR